MARMLEHCRFQQVGGKLEIAGSREFYNAVHGETDLKYKVLTAVEQHLGVAADSVVVVYLPSALRQHVPSWLSRLG